MPSREGVERENNNHGTRGRDGGEEEGNSVQQHEGYCKGGTDKPENGQNTLSLCKALQRQGGHWC